MLTRTSLLVTSLVLGACTSDELDPFALDAEAAAGGGKADGMPGIVRLEAATPAEVTASISKFWGDELERCFAAYRASVDRAATEVDREIAVAFQADDLRAGCPLAYPLADYIDGGLTEAAQDALPVDELVAAMGAWAKPILTAASIAGYVEYDELPLTFHRDLARTHDDNARAREKNPTGLRIDTQRSSWAKVRTGSVLSSEFLNPVTFPAGALDGADVFRYLRAAFPLDGTELVESGTDALQSFWEHPDAADDDPAFASIVTALKKSSIKQRYHFSISAPYITSNALIVVDRNGQAWGMYIHSTD